MILARLAAWWSAWRYRRNGERTRPGNVVRRDDGTLWTTARVGLDEAMEGLFSGRNPWIFDRLTRESDGRWKRRRPRWKTYESGGWEALVLEGKVIRGEEYLR